MPEPDDLVGEALALNPADLGVRTVTMTIGMRAILRLVNYAAL